MVVMYGCGSWTLRKNEETHLEAFEMKGLRKILRVSWTAKKTNEWVLNKAVRHCQSKEASIHHEETRELPGERNNARKSARCTQARKTTHGLDRQHQVVDRTLCRGLSVEESIKMTEDRDKWRKYVHGVANPRIEDG